MNVNLVYANSHKTDGIQSTPEMCAAPMITK